MCPFPLHESHLMLGPASLTPGSLLVFILKNKMGKQWPCGQRDWGHGTVLHGQGENYQHHPPGKDVCEVWCGVGQPGLADPEGPHVLVWGLQKFVLLSINNKQDEEVWSLRESWERHKRTVWIFKPEIWRLNAVDNLWPWWTDGQRLPILKFLTEPKMNYLNLPPNSPQ